MRHLIFGSNKELYFGYTIKIIEKNCSCKQEHTCGLGLVHGFLLGMDCEIHNSLVLKEFLLYAAIPVYSNMENFDFAI